MADSQKTKSGTQGTQGISLRDLDSRATAIGKMLYMMAQLYRIDITAELSRLWHESLTVLSVEQIEQGFRKYVSGENCDFPPKPGSIIAASGYRDEPEDALAREERRDRERKSNVGRRQS